MARRRVAAERGRQGALHAQGYFAPPPPPQPPPQQHISLPARSSPASLLPTDPKPSERAVGKNCFRGFKIIDQFVARRVSKSLCWAWPAAATGARQDSPAQRSVCVCVRSAAMIKGILVINNHGKPRLTKFYEHLVRAAVALVEALWLSQRCGVAFAGAGDRSRVHAVHWNKSGARSALSHPSSAPLRSRWNGSKR
jgi:hypothetical protein